MLCDSNLLYISTRKEKNILFHRRGEGGGGGERRKGEREGGGRKKERRGERGQGKEIKVISYDGEN